MSKAAIEDLTRALVAAEQTLHASKDNLTTAQLRFTQAETTYRQALRKLGATMKADDVPMILVPNVGTVMQVSGAAIYRKGNTASVEVAA